MNKLDGSTDFYVIAFFNQTKIFSLKIGEPAFFFTPSMRLFAEPTTFLRERYTESGRRPSPNTWANITHALTGWFNFLSEFGVKDWRHASYDDLVAYRDAYSQAISPKTGSAYAKGTIAGRMSAILSFYKFASDRKWYHGDMIAPICKTTESVEGITRQSAYQPLSHTLNIGFLGAASDLIPKRRSRRNVVRPFFDVELKVFLVELGPRATEQGINGDLRPCRDRLLGDIGVFVGLRNDEIHQLTKYHFLALHPNIDAPLAEQPLTVIGKGRIVRTVAIPNWLVLDALAYIDGERAQAIRAGGRTGRKEPPDMFLAGRESNAPGRPLTHRRFQQIIEEACIRAGLTSTHLRLDPDTGETIAVKKSKHCVHDLRHTYAVLTYWSEKLNGNPKPWKKIQAQLGHKHLDTTMNVYLSHVDIFEQRERFIDVRKLIGL